ncbi:MAG: outer membrane lipoprotein-sorting protein [Gammaproteobacteria bacterium]|nr:outer membrane lipoprotein-sorting protein [Gammaproteobacteria bacterium]
MSSKNKVALLAACVALGAASVPWAAEVKPAAPAAPANLTAAQIVERNAAARGGLAAWHAVQTMSWSGKMDAGVGDSMARSENYVKQMWANKKKSTGHGQGAAEQTNTPVTQQVQLPFVLEMKRPGKSRIELEFAGKTAVQVYDGKEGWLKRPYLNRDDWEPFSAEQLKASEGKWDMDGPLLDYAAKGTKLALEGVEKVDGQNAYKLKLTLRNGTTQHVWIDTHTFLDVKVEGTPRRMDGKLRTVWVTQRDFKSVQGLMVPSSLETAVDGYPETHKMLIEKIAVNPKLDDSRFTKPKA